MPHDSECRYYQTVECIRYPPNALVATLPRNPTFLCGTDKAQAIYKPDSCALSSRNLVSSLARHNGELPFWYCHGLTAPILLYLF